MSVTDMRDLDFYTFWQSFRTQPETKTRTSTRRVINLPSLEDIHREIEIGIVRLSSQKAVSRPAQRSIGPPSWLTPVSLMFSVIHLRTIEQGNEAAGGLFDVENGRRTS